MTVQNIIDQMESWAPPQLAESFDNVGLLVGNPAWEIKKILVALDATDAVIAEAIAGGYQAIITHHPLTYNPLKAVVATDIIGRKILALAKHEIALFSAHTNLDKAEGGVNHCLASILGLENTHPMTPDATNPALGLGLVSKLATPTTLEKLAQHVKQALNLADIRYSGSLQKNIQKVAICGGSGMSFWQDAKKAGADVYITGDVKYSDALPLLESGMCILDITHYSGENIIVDAIVKKLAPQNPGIIIEATQINGQPFFTL